MHDAKCVYQTRGSEQHAGLTSQQASQVLLQVLPVTIHGPAGLHRTYAMLDMGNTCTLIQASVADKVGLTGPTEQMILNGVQQRSCIASRIVDFGVSSVANPTNPFTVSQARTVERLNLPKISIDMSKEKNRWPHLADLPLPPVKDVDITVLLGADVFDLIVPLEIRTSPKGTPRTAMKVHITTPEEDLSHQVQLWWKTESFGWKYAGETSRSVEDKKALEILESTTKHTGERYETALLWKEDDITLPNNRIVAEKQLFSLERRLARNEELASAYRDTIESDLRKGYAKRLSRDEASAPVKHQWFFPHHPVTNPNKPGKIRRVFNAASKFKGASLNDHLMTGPNLLNSLTGILMRFRKERVAISTDIESMFSQVVVPKDDQIVLQFLWRDDRNSPPEVYQYCRHIFGAKSYLLQSIMFFIEPPRTILANSHWQQRQS